MNKEIYNTLKDRIIHLDYEPGTILKEQELAAQFGVSRTPLRTVLFRLEWEHLIKILPRTGIFVMELELSTITNVFQARLELEAVIGAMAFARMSPDQIQQFKALERKCSALKEEKNPKKLSSIDMENKQIFHQAAGNPFLAEMSEHLYALTYRLWYFNLLKMDSANWGNEVEAVREDLVILSQCFTSGNPEQLGQARKNQLLKHLERIRSSFLGLSAI
ncbi:GntR family transcriptional regulator [uncultured Desulfobacter sp.]|uniref:GntR family transcriptional regulator n=1 Tax=uncultured Desulfobacter sp. TaxID=240139 RepID=UPI0029F54322|nr:GntR family transcriptional regulator [uncultured Desulfobacter sp.]